MNKNLSKEELFESLKLRPALTVEVVVKSEEGVLLSKRKISPFKGYWHIPGGFLRMYERLEDAVHRIGKEETGLGVKIKRFLGVYDYQKGDPRGHIVSLWYLTEPKSGDLEGDFQSEELKFFKNAPRKTISFQKEILLKNGLLKS